MDSEESHMAGLPSPNKERACSGAGTICAPMKVNLRVWQHGGGKKQLDLPTRPERRVPWVGEE